MNRSYLGPFILENAESFLGLEKRAVTIQHESSASSEARHPNRCSNFYHPATSVIAESCFRKISGSFIKMSTLFASEEQHAKNIWWPKKSATGEVHHCFI